MKKIKKSSIFSLALASTMLMAHYGFSQEQSAPDTTKVSSSPAYYRQLTTGINRAILRDFATSPLFYQGWGLYLQNAWVKRSDAKDRSFEIGIGLNQMTAKIPESSFIQPSASSLFGTLHLRYLQLWKLKSISNEKNNIKIGGAIQISQNVRQNASLQNNALGVENISNLMATGQITRNISRKESRQLNLWLFKPTLKPVKRDLRFQFNAGLLNFNYRPGYAFAYDNEINGAETNNIQYLLNDSYRWSLNGWRLNTELEFITYLKNGNARSFSYVWDAAHAPGDIEAFQMFSHSLRYTLYFNLK
jgi:hypothetical protein